MPPGILVQTAILISAVQLCLSSAIGHSALFQHLEDQFRVQSCTSKCTNRFYYASYALIFSYYNIYYIRIIMIISYIDHLQHSVGSDARYVQQWCFWGWHWVSQCRVSTSLCRWSAVRLSDRSSSCCRHSCTRKLEPFAMRIFVEALRQSISAQYPRDKPELALVSYSLIREFILGSYT